MAKKLFFGNSAASFHRGNNDANMAGVASWWTPLVLSESNGAVSGGTANNLSTINGPTNGVEFGGAAPNEYISEPLSADFTISGTITLNLWGVENNMSANACLNAVIDKIDGVTGALTRIATSVNATELGTSAAAQNFTIVPASTLCHRGDRLRIRVIMDDGGGTLTTGFQVTFYCFGPAGAQGDSYVQFTENLTFESVGDPGTQSVSAA